MFGQLNYICIQGFARGEWEGETLELEGGAIYF